MDTVVFKDIKTPSYVIDENKLIHNLKILKGVEKETGCHILLAQKAFSAYAMYPLIGQYISGTTASGLYEARLGKEEMNKENHVLHQHISRRTWMNLLRYATILYLTQ